jgi:hypothetical protein
MMGVQRESHSLLLVVDPYFEKDGSRVVRGQQHVPLLQRGLRETESLPSKVGGVLPHTPCIKPEPAFTIRLVYPS